ncbi:MAG: site-2 protease family protein [Pseudanabaenaceae cyanobacterium SKYGB_i_bin29]|nr:site-2 protease family protein [Pseudanabaenaceae cyanobacterium SKYG29]MDW8421588.1 site-2 protease family protein [Pseudanabaenaceae cyanobacterium SKYGB_i_bin29]
MLTEYLVPIFLLLSTLTLLGWHYLRGKGIGNWQQILVILLPGIGYFVLSLGGIHINPELFLPLCLIAIGIYILLGNYPPPREAKEVKPMVTTNPIENKDDLKQLQGIFGIESFYPTSSQPFRDGYLFKGNLRTEPELAYKQLSTNLEEKFGNKYELFLVNGQDGKPIVIILPPQTIPEQPWWQNVAAVVLLVLGIFSSGVVAGEFLHLDWREHPLPILAYSLGIILFLGAREITQRYIGRQANLSITPPFLLPSLQLGAFGLFSRVLSPFPNRKVLFDFAAAPAITGIVISTVLLMWGLGLTPNLDQGIEVPSQIFQTSILVGTIAKLLLGKSLATTFIVVHPLVLFGWLGMVITALNLLPAGQLEGGRIMQAMFGRQVAGWATLVTLLFLAAASIINSLALYWAGLIFLLLRDQERPMHDELTELDNDRDALGLFLLFWTAVTLLPMSGEVADYLGIGG